MDTDSAHRAADLRECLQALGPHTRCTDPVVLRAHELATDFLGERGWIDVMMRDIRTGLAAVVNRTESWSGGDSPG